MGQRIKTALDAAKVTQRQLSQALGVKDPSVTAYVQGASNLPAEAYAVISDLCNVSIDWIIKGGETTSSQYPDVEHEEEITSVSELPEGYIKVPRYEVAASAGGGALVESEQIVDYLMFQTDWVKSTLGTKVDQLALISVVGDSMSPTYNAGDLILVDTSAGRARSDAVYVIQHDSCLWVKRLHFHFDGSIAVISDNPRYPEQAITGEALERLRIVGRVVWKGGR